MFHSGELAVQERMGVASKAARIGRSISPTVHPYAAEFLGEVDTFAVGGLVESQVQLWLMSARATAPTENRIELEILDSWPDWTPPPIDTPVGILAIDFSKRHRMRFNGRVQLASSGHLNLKAEQVYGNCPKYIQKRGLELEASSTLPASESLDALFNRIDTFIFATISPEGGADVSHRGGKPGFVRYNDGLLSWSEYPGNTMYNTLGNLEHDSRAAVLALDFEGRRAVRLSGQATVDYGGDSPRVGFTVQDTTWAQRPLPWHVASLEPSPFNP